MRWRRWASRRAIVPGATAFLHGIRWGVPALTLFYCMRYLSEGLHWTLPTMLLSAGGLLVLLPLGYVLTFGRLGFPELGAGGLGIASAVMLWLQMLGFVVVLWRSRRFADLRLFERFDPPRWPMIRELLATGLPIGVTVLMEGGLFIATALLIGRLGEVPAAAHQIAINVASLCFMVPMGMAEATTVRVGHALGRDDRDGVRRAAFAGYAIVLGTQLLSGTALVLGNELVVGFYTADADRGRAGRLAAAVRGGVPVPRRRAGAVGRRAARAQGHAHADAAGRLCLLGHRHAAGRRARARAWAGVRRGMWIGLIAGLSVAALLLCLRFLRSSAPARLSLRRAPPLTQPEAAGCYEWRMKPPAPAGTLQA